MRCMAGDRQHKIVVIRIHFFDLRPQRLPIARQLRHSRGIGAVGGQKTPAIVKQLGKARPWPGMLGARQRMARHKMHPRRHMWRNRLHHRTFHRAHIRDRSTRLDIGGRLSHHRPHRAHRQAKHHQIRLTHRTGEIIVDHIA